VRAAAAPVLARELASVLGSAPELASAPESASASGSVPELASGSVPELASASAQGPVWEWVSANVGA
jgi:hypothetical protein